MDASSKIVLRFDRFCLDLSRGSLRLDDTDIFLRPKSFEVLSYLALNPGRLISKQELDEAVWPNTAVTDASLAQCIRELRDKLEDSQRTLVKTVHRRGYMLDATVTKVELTDLVDCTTSPESDSERKPAESALTGQTTRLQSTFARLSKSSIPLFISIVLICAVALVYSGTSSRSWFGARSASSGSATSQIADLTTFQDCEKCPQMVVLPRSNGKSTSTAADLQKPAMQILIPNRIAVGRFEVTIAQYEEFVTQTNHPVAASCVISLGAGASFQERVPANADFRRPGLDVSPSYSASCVNWYDAKAYVAWLERRTGKLYRLLTDLEWEYAARAGTTGTFSFSGGAAHACQYVRFADLDSPYPQASSCHSGHQERGSLPVGSLKPNAWGLHDVHGNVWEWVEDCALGNLSILATNVSMPARQQNCEIGIARGGGFGSSLWRSAVSFRLDPFPVLRHQAVGFRVAVSLE